MDEKKKIIVVEDDEFFREAVASILCKKYEVLKAPNGKEAKNLISMIPFDLVLSDVQMPFLTGIELLEWVKEKRVCKFILMTGFANILETHKAHELGADGFLAKPFSDKELLDEVHRLIKPIEVQEKPPKSENLDSKFCKVPIEDFVTDKEFEHNIFLRVNESKYLKIAHKGGKIPAYRVQAFKEKDIHFFYIDKNDFGHLVDFTLSLSKAVASSGVIVKEKKDRFIRYTGEMIVQHVFSNGLNENTFLVAKDFTNLSLETICDDTRIIDVLHNFNEYADHLYVHSLAVSTFSVMIAQSMGWKRQSLLFKLSMAGLFHDIGKKEIPKEVLFKSRAELTQKEIALLESHPMRGKEILESLKNIPSDVVTVALEHHENIAGNGYPRRLTKLQIHPLTHIVSVANIFAKYTVHNPNYPEPLSAKDAIKLMEQNYTGFIDPLCFEVLKNVISSKAV